MRSKNNLLPGLALMALSAVFLAGQATTGSIVGDVKDEDGKYLRGVTVSVLNIASNAASTVVTSGKKAKFRALALAPGSYQVSFDLAGYVSYVASGIRLSSEQTFTLQVTLKKKEEPELSDSADLPRPAKSDMFFVSAGAAAVFPGDSRFRDFYGKVQISPQFRVGCAFFKNYYIWMGGNSFSAKGSVPVLEDETKASQTFLTLVGLGYETGRKRNLQADLFAGLFMVRFKEASMGITANRTALGFEIGAGLRFYLKKRIFLEALFGYAETRSTFQSELEDIKITLGGVRLSGLLGFRF